RRLRGRADRAYRAGRARGHAVDHGGDGARGVHAAPTAPRLHGGRDHALWPGRRRRGGQAHEQHGRGADGGGARGGPRGRPSRWPITEEENSMADTGVLLDGFTRVRESLHRMLPDLTEAELTAEPHPPIGWLAWRLTRIIDSNVARLSSRDQLWIGDGWAARFGMPPEPFDFGRAATHTREQVRAFRASSKLLLDYHDATHDRLTAYLAPMTAVDLARVLDEPQYQPLPTVAVRLMSLLENGMHNVG